MCAAFTVCALCSLEEPQRLFLPLLLLEIMNSDLYIQQDRLELLHSVPRRLNDCFHCKLKEGWGASGCGAGVEGWGWKTDYRSWWKEVISSCLTASCSRVYAADQKRAGKKDQLALCVYANELACARKKGGLTGVDK